MFEVCSGLFWCATANRRETPLNLASQWFAMTIFENMHDVNECFVTLSNYNTNLVDKLLAATANSILCFVHCAHWLGQCFNLSQSYETKIILNPINMYFIKQS